MTDQKHLKRRIRTRMARTGERYSVARAHVVGRQEQGQHLRHGPVVDHGHPLRGGVHPDSAAAAALLARHGRDVSEAMVFGVGGGPGAGYILWEFAAHDSRVLTLGFRHRWNYLDGAERALTRLGATPVTHTTAGRAGAAGRLTEALADGRPALTWPDNHLVGYWHLPAHLNGHGGHGVLAYAEHSGRVHLDDRNLAPLTVDREAFDIARARVPSYRNRLVTLADAVTDSHAATGTGAAGTGAGVADLAAAVDAGIADTLAQLGGTSESFALPAWRKWARLVTDPRHAKGWPKVFADGRGLTGALLSTWEAVEPAGMDGGHLRDLYADFLEEAATLLDRPALAEAAAPFREAGRCWHEVAETALPLDVPAYARLRELTAEVAMGVVAGDDGAAARAEAATELWALRSEYDRTPPAAPDFAGIGAALTTAYDAERAAVDRLAKAAADAG